MKESIDLLREIRSYTWKKDKDGSGFLPEPVKFLEYNIQTGDIFGIKGSGILGWMSERLLVTPSGAHTDRYHFGMIGDPVFSGSGKVIDWETHESLWKGPANYRFFKQYLGKDVEIFRVPGLNQSLVYDMVHAISAIGNRPYGYKDFFLLFADLFRLLLKERRMPPYTAQDLTYSANEEYICTELVAYAMRQIKRPLEPPGYPDIWDVPTVYLQAVQNGRLNMIYKGNLTDLTSKSVR